MLWRVEAGADVPLAEDISDEDLLLAREHKLPEAIVQLSCLQLRCIDLGNILLRAGGLFSGAGIGVRNVLQGVDVRDGELKMLLLGDSAGFVNMLKIKGLHNAIDSGIQAAKAIAASLDNPNTAAEKYTANVEQSNIARGNIEHPTDPTIVLTDRLKIQLAMGGKNAATWEASGRQIASQIETRLGPSAGRKEARRARHTW